MTRMKPHHFVDILKLYGAGVHPFVPDEAFGHDFYRVANLLIEHPETQLTLTAGADSICGPCNRLGGDGRCTDPLDVIPGYTSKEAWNRTLDERLLALLGLREGGTITARALCTALAADPGGLAAVWREEPEEKTKERLRLFRLGTARYSTIQERQETT